MESLPLENNYSLLILFFVGFLAILFFYRENLMNYYQKMKEKIYEYMIKQYIHKNTIKTTHVPKNSSLYECMKNIGIY